MAASDGATDRHDDAAGIELSSKRLDLLKALRNGVVDGACGVGGATAQQDEDCARAGVAKL